MGNTRRIIRIYRKIEAEKIVFTKLCTQLEAGAFTDVGNGNWGSDFTALDQ